MIQQTLKSSLILCLALSFTPVFSQLPQRSDRVANYSIEAELNVKEKTIDGQEVLEWRNTSDTPLSEFYFHLYLNAFKNDHSTYFLEKDDTTVKGRKLKEDEWGDCRIDRITLLADSSFTETDLTPTLGYVQPDDGNPFDRTVFRISTPQPLPPGQSLKLNIQFTSKLPLNFDRAGFKNDFFFVAQWFPKIGVYWHDSWNCHQFHANSEFFADFGVYDVKITVPDRFVIGATGQQLSRTTTGGKTLYHYYQEDVHDFAWTASPDFKVVTREFKHPSLPSVQVRLLLQPEHRSQAERYFRAVFNALRFFGEWYGAYPYKTLTVVDPPYGSAAGGMEYPTLITAGTRLWAPDGVFSPEGVIVHEFGHQYWYGLVANNEFEEAWLDEGFNTYSTAKVLQRAYGDNHFVRRYFGGIPLVSREIKFRRHDRDRAQLRTQGTRDEMVRRAWEYDGSYGLNSYAKPGVILFTLERLLGEETMSRVMRTYHRRWRFGHPTTADFISTVNEVAQRDMTQFFKQTFYSSSLVDYSIGWIKNHDESEKEGIFDPTPPSTQTASDDTDGSPDGPNDKKQTYRSEILVRRLGEARLPVEILIRFEDGSEKRESWDGQYRWKRFEYDFPSKVVEAVVDPDRMLPLDVNFTNNSLLAEPKRPWGAVKWASRWLFWFQHLLEIFAVLS